jgi:hypothetical protein
MSCYVRGTPLQLVEAIEKKNMRRLKDANLEQLASRLALLQRWAESELEGRKRAREALPLPMVRVRA